MATKETFEVIVETVVSTRYITKATTPNEAEQTGERLAESGKRGEVLDIEILSATAALLNENDEGEVEPAPDEDEAFYDD